MEDFPEPGIPTRMIERRGAPAESAAPLSRTGALSAAVAA
jgi:hypothetical protein